MPTLAVLKNKWFLDFSGSDLLGGRHDGSSVVTSTDNNTIQVLDEGDEYMSRWHDLLTSPVGAGQHIYHSGWKIDNVRTLGPGTGPASSEALHVLETVHTGGSFVSLAISFHATQRHLDHMLRLGANGLGSAAIDMRFPAGGSNHQKFIIKKNGVNAIALLGSADITIDRWDNDSHLLPVGATGSGSGSGLEPDDPNQRRRGLTHEVVLEISGPCVTDIEHTYLERWNDPPFSSRGFGLRNVRPVPIPHPLGPGILLTTPPLIGTPAGTYPGTGSISIQTLHTYGITNRPLPKYSWAGTGEFTIWRSYLNAIETASEYIYIEDQYFISFDWPVCHSRPAGTARDTDLIFQLGEAIKRGVRVGLLIPDTFEDGFGENIRHQRQIALHYLANIASSHTGDFFVAHISNGGNGIFVHSKIMLVDDEFALIGSANFNQRSMTHDGEIQLGIVDSNNLFVKNLRKKLYREHTGRSLSSLDDPIIAYNTYKADALASHHRVRPYSTAAPGPTPRRHAFWMTNIVDPYAGPSGIR